MNETKGTILIVDDEESIRTVLSRDLQAEGYNCVTAAGGKEALETASAQDFDLVLTDMRIPGISGIEVLSQIATDHPDTSVIMISAVADMQTAVEAMKLGACDYVTKPFKLDDVMVRVERALERNRLIRENRGYELRLAEQALRESEEQYSALVSNIADAVLRLTEGTITWCNDHVAAILGCAKDELIGTDVSSLLAEAIGPSELTKLLLAATDDQSHFRGIMKVKKTNGNILDIEFSISRIPMKSPVEFVAVARDVTQRKKLEEEQTRLEVIYSEHSHILSQFYVDLEAAKEALRESEERFRSVAETAGDAIISTGGNGNVVFWNRAARTMFGYSADEAVGKPFTLMIPGRLRQAYEDELNRVLSTAKSKSIRRTTDFSGLRKDGSEFPVELSIATWKMEGETFFTAIIRDITERRRSEEALQRAHDELEIRVKERTADLAATNHELQIEIGERKRAESALRQSEEKYRTIFENSAIAITVTDENEKIVSWNKLAEDLLGMDRDDLYMKPVSSLYPEVEWRKIRAQNLRRRGMRHYLETRMITKNQQIIDVDLSLSVLKGPNGAVTGSIGIVADITERKRAEGERQRMEQQLQLTGRLAAVGQLAAGVAHELNNPLAAVQGFAQLLASRKDLDETIKADVETIYSEAQRAARITGNLLFFARRHKPEKRPISINEVIEKSLELHAYRMRVNNIEVSTELDPDVPKTLADFHQLQQVFVNIITNAEQAMTEAHSKGKLSVRTKKVGETVQMTFTDDGPGMPEDDVKRVFDPFFTTKEVGKGTGLGLSICYGIVKGHGGHIYAKSKPGKGATFVIEIPIVSEAEDDASDEQSETSWGHSGLS